MRKIFVALLITTFTLCLSLQVFADTNSLNSNFPETISPSIILIDSKTGQVLYGKNIHEELYPASITKVMTALLTLENCKLDEKVIASERAVNEIEFASSNVGFSAGEELTVEQLLYALMLESANEAANILAEHIGGSIEGFADMMNARAEELGALNTHFINPNGLHHEDHKTTVYDMSLITKQAMTMPEFRQIINTTYFEMPSTNKYLKSDKKFYNHNKLLFKNNPYYYPYAIGGKTGYTSVANHSLVACASKDGMELIAVCMNSSKANGISYPYSDSIKLFEYAFNNYSLKEPIKAGTLVKQLIVLNAKEGNQLQVIAQNDVHFLCPLNYEGQGYTTKEEINTDLKAPLNKDTTVGYIEYLIDGVMVGRTKLVTANSVEALSASKAGFTAVIITVLVILRNILIAVIILFAMLVIWAKIKRRSMKKKSHQLKIERLIRD